MLGRKNFTKEEITHARSTIAAQLKAYKALVKVVGAGPADTLALAAFEQLFFNNLLLALDRPFVHRIRAVTGKDGNPLNEVELLCECLIDHDGVLTANKVIKLVPDQSVVGLDYGDPIELSQAQFEKLSAAFFGELEARFGE
jgi:hypothetical protein